MGLFTKNKRKYVVKKRTTDDKPYKIPSIFDDEIILKQASPVNIITSPHFGDDVDDGPIAVQTVSQNMDLYNDFREVPENEEVRSEYNEFWKVRQRVVKGKEKEKEEIKEPIENNDDTSLEEIKEETSSISSDTNIDSEVKELEEEPVLFHYEEEIIENVRENNAIKVETKQVEEESVKKEPKKETNYVDVFDDNYTTQKEKEVNRIIEEKKAEPIPDGYSAEEYALIKSGHNSPSFKNFILPPLTLLNSEIESSESDDSWINESARRIDESLLAFRIKGKVVDKNTGPTFTRYSIELEAGVSGSKIEQIQNDLQRTLEAQTIRIENPIPGKPYVGIEVPNKVRRSVNLIELLNTREFLESKDPTLIPVGLDVEGNCRYVSISSLPHGLVAGSSGSGKSVFLNTLVTSLIFKGTPDDIRFFFIDPKKVDLQAYSKIPHLLSPIVDDVKGGIASIKWLLDEMERRFALFRILGVPNLKTFREAIKTKPEFKQVPYIICIIDEAGDFLMNGGNEAMDLVTKLIQKSRAAGIHLFISMQKPIAKILSTTIKSNAQGRFALRVPSSQDSLTILDSSGADKLLGNGDMIFATNGISGRYQSAYVSNEEIFNITSFVQKECPQDFYFDPNDLDKKDSKSKGLVKDELFADVARYVVQNQKCSINQMTKDFNMGYNRASDIVNLLEYYQIVSENQGTKPREILVDELELEDILRHTGN